MVPDAQQSASGALGEPLGRRATGCDDLHHLDVLQPDERRPAPGHGLETVSAPVGTTATGVAARGGAEALGDRIEPLLVVDGLTRHFPLKGGLFKRTKAVVQAVDEVSFSLRKGETLGIVGESGCGKSTTARLLMHLIKADKGTIT